VNNKQVYAVPNLKYARAEAARIVNWLQKNPPAPHEELRVVFTKLRELNPFVFEEVLLYCCRLWKYHVLPKEGFTKDNGIDGCFAYKGYFYTLQAKLYSGEANPEHLRLFSNAIGWHHAAKGFFMHTGKTSEEFKQAAAELKNIEVVSGQKLVDFILGKKPLYLQREYLLLQPENERHKYQ
jgi:restriction system protein